MFIMEFIIMGAAFLLLVIVALVLECRSLYGEVEGWVRKAHDLSALIYEGRTTICSLEFELTSLYDDVTDYRELFEATLAEREALSADLVGTTAECRRLRLENDELRALMFVSGVTEFSGDKQAMSHRLYGRQSDLIARRGKRDRKREYR